MNRIVLLHPKQPVDYSHLVSRERLILDFFGLAQTGWTDPVALFEQCCRFIGIFLISNLVAYVFSEHFAALAMSFLSYLYVSPATGYHLEPNFNGSFCGI